MLARDDLALPPVAAHRQMTAPVTPRSRVGLALALAVTVTLGLLSRRHPLPGVLAEYTGDALYALAATWCCAIVAANGRAAMLALAGFSLSAAVELSQLLQFEWLLRVRGTRVGGLVLGHGFKWPDFLAYLVGAAVGWALLGLGTRRAAERN